MKTKDIPDRPILEYLANNQGEWTMLWCGHLKKDLEVKDVYYAMPENTHEKLALSKMRSLYKRGLIDGCPCGCRGDWEITDKGLAYIGKSRTKEMLG